MTSYNLTDGLIGYWPFDGNAKDQSGNNNHGTVVGATLTEDRFGNSNSAYEFNGINNYINCGNNLNITSETTYSISAWIYAENNLTNDGHIFGGRYGDRDSFILMPDGKIFLRLDDSGSTSTGSIIWNQWNHVIAVYKYETSNEQKDSNVSYYINGIYDSTPNISWHNGVFDTWTSGNRWIGWESRFNKYFKGKIDDIRIYNRALNEKEIKFLAKNHPCISNTSNTHANTLTEVGPTEDLVGFWPLDETSKDYSGNNNHGE
jgi:hypothetical protein